ncbi:VOC family protein [Hydrocarboniphaga sp.]|uniref:VOC family protein n=1 Tax=Hydrocarboniphaga sp. TaxID=2033016 RepID=UPI003D149B4D
MGVVAQDIAYVRYAAPDLERMEVFLRDFGLTRVLRTERALYMRGIGPEPFVHVTELGEAAALGFGLKAASVDDLQRLAALRGVDVHDSDEPAGGQRVTLVDPDGFRVDFVWGATPHAALPAKPAEALNSTGMRRRLNTKQRFQSGPSHVMRLGHVVLKVRDFGASQAFYSSVFGMRAAASYYANDPAQTLMAFMRCGLGQTFTDHHTLGIHEVPNSRGIEHSAFEVVDWDDLCVGNTHLTQKGYEHSWGIGRHLEGSQIFDYWRDPFGNKIEHWTDGDSINDDYHAAHSQLNPDDASQWSPPLPPNLFPN